MKAILLLLATLAFPLAQANHVDTCGPADGNVQGVVFVWLDPGCEGAYVWLQNCWSNLVIVHGQVLQGQAFVWGCGAGVWSP